MSRHWTTKAQRRYMKLLEVAGRKEYTDRAMKLRSDACLEGCITSGQYFLIEDAIGEAYRAGLIDALMEEK